MNGLKIMFDLIHSAKKQNILAFLEEKWTKSYHFLVLFVCYFYICFNICMYVL